MVSLSVVVVPCPSKEFLYSQPDSPHTVTTLHQDVRTNNNCATTAEVAPDYSLALRGGSCISSWTPELSPCAPHMHCFCAGCSMPHLARLASCHCSSDGRLSPPGATGRRPDTSMETERRLGRLSYSSSSVLACGGCTTSPASSSAVRDGEDASGCVRFFLKCCCRDLSLVEQQGW